MVDSKQDTLGEKKSQESVTNKQPSPYSESSSPQKDQWTAKLHKGQPSPYSERG